MTATVHQLPAYTPPNWDAEVGQRVKTLLIGRATQAQLGTLLSLTQSDVSRRLNGRVSWKGRELDTVARALGVSVAVLYGETETAPFPPVNEKGPESGVPDPSLPDLDSNQEPTGIESAPSWRARPVVDRTVIAPVLAITGTW